MMKRGQVEGLFLKICFQKAVVSFWKFLSKMWWFLIVPVYLFSESLQSRLPQAHQTKAANLGLRGLWVIVKQGQGYHTVPPHHPITGQGQPLAWSNTRSDQWGTYPWLTQVLKLIHHQTHPTPTRRPRCFVCLCVCPVLWLMWLLIHQTNRLFWSV